LKLFPGKKKKEAQLDKCMKINKHLCKILLNLKQ